MGRKQVAHKPPFGTAPPSDSDSSEEDQSEVEEIQEEVSLGKGKGKGKGKRSQEQAAPSRSRGHGRHAADEGSSRGGRGGRGRGPTGRVPPSYDDNIDITYFGTSLMKMEKPRRTARDPPIVDYKKSSDTDMRATRYGVDPRKSQRSFRGDTRFWLPFQADWYESVIMSMKHPTTEMKYVDWDYLRRLASPIKEVVEEIYENCTKKRLVNIMAFRCDWNEEVVAQFYATLHVHEDPTFLLFTLGGKHFEIKVAEFA